MTPEKAHPQIPKLNFPSPIAKKSSLKEATTSANDVNDDDDNIKNTHLH